MHACHLHEQQLPHMPIAEACSGGPALHASALLPGPMASESKRAADVERWLERQGRAVDADARAAFRSLSLWAQEAVMVMDARRLERPRQLIGRIKKVMRDHPGQPVATSGWFSHARPAFTRPRPPACRPPPWQLDRAHRARGREQAQASGPSASGSRSHAAVPSVEEPLPGAGRSGASSEIAMEEPMERHDLHRGHGIGVVKPSTRPHLHEAMAEPLAPSDVEPMAGIVRPSTASDVAVEPQMERHDSHGVGVVFKVGGGPSGGAVKRRRLHGSIAEELPVEQPVESTEENTMEESEGEAEEIMEEEGCSDEPAVANQRSHAQLVYV